MSTFLITTAAAGLISGNVVAPSESEQLGIAIDIIERGMSHSDHPPLTSFTMRLEDFDSCDLGSVWLDILDAQGYVIFGSNLASLDGIYRFSIDSRFVQFSNLAVGCKTGASTPDDIFFLNLGDYVRAH